MAARLATPRQERFWAACSVRSWAETNEAGLELAPHAGIPTAGSNHRLRTDQRKGLSIRQQTNAEMNQADSKGRDLRGGIVFAFALGVVCYLAWQLRAVLLLLYVSALAAVVLTPIVRATSRFRIGRFRPFKGRAILILILAVAGGLTAFGFLALPPVIRDLQEFGREMPTRLP